MGVNSYAGITWQLLDLTWPTDSEEKLISYLLSKWINPVVQIVPLTKY